MAEASKSENFPSKSLNQNEHCSELAGDLVEAVSSQLLDEVKTVYADTGKLSDDVLASLNNVFQAPLLPALDLVDNRSVTLVTCPAGRSVYQVIGSSGTPYTCFTTSNYCSCPAYRFSVLKKQDHIFCKHILAVKLCVAMDVCKHLQVSDQELANIIQGVD